MEADSWSDRLSAALKRSEAALQSRSDIYMFEDFDGEEDTRTEFPCPFCSEDFDIVGLCCHIDDEHLLEAKNGVCPVCAMRVGMDMVGHITMQHGHLFKMQRKRRFSKGSHSTLSLLRKELREGNLHFLRGGSSLVSSSNTAPDPLLSSFIYNMPIGDELESVQPHSSAEASAAKKSSEENVVGRSVQSSPPLSDKEQEEKARRCKFVQGLLLSTIFDDDVL